MLGDDFMKYIKKFLAIFLCIVFCAFVMPVASAATKPKITVSNQAALPGNEVTLDVNISNNPGIMAMTFSVVYDAQCFEFVKLEKGYVASPVYKNHANKGYISFSISETSNKTNSGNIMSLTFKIKNDAPAGKYEVFIANHYYEDAGENLENCFANSNGKYIIPTTKKGSITVQKICDYEGHIFGEWEILNEATCLVPGNKARVCTRCGEREEKIVTKEHEFEDEWTVDRPATPEVTGIMSRHCKNCIEVTDSISFRYEEIIEDNTTPDDNQNTSSDDEGTTTTSSNQESANNTGNKKPIINNTEGAKNPLQEVEKLNGYKEHIKPNEDKNASSSVEKDNSSTASSPIINSNEKDKVLTDGEQNNTSSLFNPLGIVLMAVCLILSIGIIVLGIVLIIKNRKSQ